MTDRVLTLDALCAVLVDTLRETNASLARDVPLARDAGADADADSNAGSDGAGFPYRIERETKYALRTIPYSAFQHVCRYQLMELRFSVPCCVVTRRVGSTWQTVLMLHLPAWWQRLGRAPVCRGMHIDVRADADAPIALRFSPIERIALPRRGDRWTLLLTQNQKQTLASSAGPATETPPTPSRAALHRRIAQWLRRTFTANEIHDDTAH
ncbi:hypothetical protein [Paraburkholderia solisilvae]|uniref:Uncharacterized protein n=1 Tax=Paraburkholderia solisilvae TaxID=624376 RepID=A0A6J5E923_9BURK|nr:hypothetical protein [Paraburkholderia solisilvae]CAB3761816.1 hypothetical protein LMG29739_03726 [Paraburkholderia solisilvae]